MEVNVFLPYCRFSKTFTNFVLIAEPICITFSIWKFDDISIFNNINKTRQDVFSMRELYTIIGDV